MVHLKQTALLSWCIHLLPPLCAVMWPLPRLLLARDSLLLPRSAKLISELRSWAAYVRLQHINRFSSTVYAGSLPATVANRRQATAKGSWVATARRLRCHKAIHGLSTRVPLTACHARSLWSRAKLSFRACGFEATQCFKSAGSGGSRKLSCFAGQAALLKDGSQARLNTHMPFTRTLARFSVKSQVGLDVAGIKSRKVVGLWLGGCAVWVYSMVILGGLTRLTRSGLSMTDWKFSGETPPMNQAAWRLEFGKYQQSPEYQLVNRSMSLEEFKFIYWMEYAHRMWGRVLGLVFLGPAVYFAARGYINRPLGRRLGLLLLMGGSQGLVGWWMVKSGLENPKNEYQTPRVSPYRLAAHLGSAFVIYGTLVWTSLSLLRPPAAQAASAAQIAGSAALCRHMLPLAGLITLTAVSEGASPLGALHRTTFSATIEPGVKEARGSSLSRAYASLVFNQGLLAGAFVAGTEAGLAYNTFPLMAGKLIPEEYWSLPGWRNAFENTAAVQFHHRLLAVSTLTAVGLVFLRHRGTALQKMPRLLLNSLPGVTALQVGLGISTLLALVPPGLGAAHQATALALLTIALSLLHTLRPAITASNLLRLASPAALAATGIAAASAYQSKSLPEFSLP